MYNSPFILYFLLEPPVGIEPTTSRLQVAHSAQLRYGGVLRTVAKFSGVTGTSFGLTITVRFAYEDLVRLIITSVVEQRGVEPLSKPYTETDHFLHNRKLLVQSLPALLSFISWNRQEGM